jgi:RNA polymerase sigma-70 factor (ECF subfamily)
MPTSHPDNESLLLKQIAGGSETAFAELFYTYKDKLYSFLLPMTGADAAEDLVQEVFLKIWTKKEDLNSVDNAGAYIFRMAKNKAIDALKRSLHYETILKEEARIEDRNSIDTSEVLKIKNLKQQIHYAVESLPPQQKKVYLLSREEGLKLEEIASQMGISLATVKNHLVQAMRNLRDKLGAEHPKLGIALILAIAELLKTGN